MHPCIHFGREGAFCTKKIVLFAGLRFLHNFAQSLGVGVTHVICCSVVMRNYSKIHRDYVELHKMRSRAFSAITFCKMHPCVQNECRDAFAAKKIALNATKHEQQQALALAKFFVPVLLQ